MATYREDDDDDITGSGQSEGGDDVRARNAASLQKTPRKYQTQDSSDKNADNWKTDHTGMVYKMSLERLREAMRRKDVALINRAIEECGQQRIPESDPDIVEARLNINTITLKRDLKAAVDRKSPEAIYSALDAIEQSHVRKYLQNEMREARHAAETYSRLHCLQRAVLDMDKYTMSEIRRYSSPPYIVTRVMQAALLLLGVDEDTSANWKTCLKLINPHGPNGLNAKVMQMDMSQVHPEIAARAREMLDELDVQLPKVKSVSLGAGTFYVWCMGVVEEVERQTKQDAESRGHGKTGPKVLSVRPASVARQREIFGTLPSTNSQSPRRGRRGTQTKGRPGNHTQRDQSPDKYRTATGQPVFK